MQGMEIVFIYKMVKIDCFIEKEKEVFVDLIQLKLNSKIYSCVTKIMRTKEGLFKKNHIY